VLPCNFALSKVDYPPYPTPAKIWHLDKDLVTFRQL
jgi:hypothetical protein